MITFYAFLTKTSEKTANNNNKANLLITVGVKMLELIIVCCRLHTFYSNCKKTLFTCLSMKTLASLRLSVLWNTHCFSLYSTVTVQWKHRLKKWTYFVFASSSKSCSSGFRLYNQWVVQKSVTQKSKTCRQIFVKKKKKFASNLK